MDAFYASVEQRDQPALRGKPLAVAWGGKRSVVLTASYEARPFGVRSAMPLYKALARCPDLLVMPPRFAAYRAISEQIHQIFGRYTALVEPLALDEAYLDVTQPLRGPPSATLIAKAIRQDIWQETQLTAAAGVSVNKFLAKLASGMNKPAGLTVLLPADAERILPALAVGDFHGIGPATAQKLERLGIRTGADLRAADPEMLAARFGKVGRHFWRIAHGQDDRPVQPERQRKSVGTEETYAEDLFGVEAVKARLPALAQSVETRLERAGGLAGRTVMLKIKFVRQRPEEGPEEGEEGGLYSRRVVTRRLTLPQAICSAGDIAAAAARLLTPELLAGRGVRLAGITLTGLVPTDEHPQQRSLQPRLFD